MSLDPIDILVTSVGNDGFPSVLQGIKSNSERLVRVVGVDSQPSAPGLYLADKGYLVPLRSAREKLLNRLAEICRKEKIHVIYPLSTEDQEFFAAEVPWFAAKGISVIVSPLDVLQIANDKLKLYEFSQANGIPCPSFSAVRNWKDLQQTICRLGFPHRPFVLRLNRSTGAQGVKVVYAEIDARKRMFDRDNRLVGLHEVERWLQTMQSWPPFHLAEYLPGDEYSVDILCDGGNVLSAVTRLRLSTLYGLALHARVVDERDVQQSACRLVEKLGLSFVVNVQFRRSENGEAKLMEINPRIPGTIGLTVAAGVNMPYMALKMILGEPFTLPTLRIGTVIMRYWDAVYTSEDSMLR